ncbi:MAG TPA: GNAT family N-acetyltransferase [Anaerolineales bacterium]|nr:GNAT family N-acetyltransferase [Anaerolineales bacterium]
MISIRRAKPEEAALLSKIAIAAKSHWNYPEHWMELWIPQLTFGPTYFEEHESWVSELDQEPIGFYTLQDRAGKAWIENLWVLPTYMGKGIGNQLFQHAVGLARQHGYRILQLESDPNAVGFYEKMGMRKIGERRYELDGQPRILPLMEMAL